MRKPTYIIVHHSLTEDSKTVSWGAIERYHTEVKGWKDIGYHAGIELIGGDYYALIGRSDQEDAAAVKEANMNQLGLHVCCIGNYDNMPPTISMLEALVKRIIKPWMVEYNIGIDHIKAHRDYAPYKSCPGTQFNMDQLRNMVKAYGDG